MGRLLPLSYRSNSVMTSDILRRCSWGSFNSLWNPRSLTSTPSSSPKKRLCKEFPCHCHCRCYQHRNDGPVLVRNGAIILYRERIFSLVSRVYTGILLNFHPHLVIKPKKRDKRNKVMRVYPDSTSILTQHMIISVYSILL